MSDVLLICSKNEMPNRCNVLHCHVFVCSTRMCFIIMEITKRLLIYWDTWNLSVLTQCQHNVSKECKLVIAIINGLFNSIIVSVLPITCFLNNVKYWDTLSFATCKPYKPCINIAFVQIDFVVIIPWRLLVT